MFLPPSLESSWRGKAVVLGTSITQPGQDPRIQCGPQLTKLADNYLFSYLHTHVNAPELELLEGKACVLITIFFQAITWHIVGVE